MKKNVHFGEKTMKIITHQKNITPLFFLNLTNV